MKYEVTANICRVCLTKNKKLRSLYIATDVDEIPPNIMIEEVTGIHVEEMSDLPMLPKNICKNCELSLSMAYEFRVKTLKSKRIIDLYISRLAVNDTKQQKQQRQQDIKNDTTNVADQRNRNVQEEGTDIEMFIALQQVDVDASDDDNFDADTDAIVNANAGTSGDDCNIRLLDSKEGIHDGDDSEEFQEICKTEEENIVEDCNRNVEGISRACSPEANILETELQEPEDEEQEEHYYNINNRDNDEEKVAEDGTEDIGMDEIFEEHLEMEKLPQTTESTKNQHNESNLQNDIATSEEYDNQSEMVGNKKRTKGKTKKSSTVQLLHICDICGNVYMKRGRMMEHRQRHDKELKYSCELCDKKFHMRELLRKHMYLHNGGKPLKCDYCSRTFYYESVRKAHENVHKGLRPYICDVCGKSFCYAHTLKKHKLIHTEIKLYRCDYCNKDFRLQHHMKQHELTKLHKNAVLLSKGQNPLALSENFFPNEKSAGYADSIYTEAVYTYK